MATAPSVGETASARIVRIGGRLSVVRIPRSAFARSDVPSSPAVISAQSDEHVDLLVSPALRLAISARHPALTNPRHLAAGSFIAAARNQYMWDVDIALALGAEPSEAGVKRWRAENAVPHPPSAWPSGWDPPAEPIERARRLLAQGGTSQPEPQPPLRDNGPAGLVIAAIHLAKEGELLDRYYIVRQIGRGGMGVVYAAVEEELNRAVALKVIAPQMAGDENARQRFIREARTAAAIDHPNAIPIYGVGDVDGLLYIAMRLVDGPTLHEVIRKEVFLEAARASTVIGQVAGALDAAHAQNIVHRDVKPQNILIASHGATEHAYLTDFGLARLITDTGLTRPGDSLGTPSYMAPEQIRGTEIDHRADVYSLGCVLYEVLTGELPYPMETRDSLYYAHLNAQPPRASGANSALPIAIDEVIAQALAKDPEARFGTAGELAAATEVALAV